MDFSLFMGRIRPKEERLIRVENRRMVTHGPYGGIAYAEFRGHYVILSNENGEYSTRMTLGKMLDMLGRDEFVQVHRHMRLQFGGLLA